MFSKTLFALPALLAWSVSASPVSSAVTSSVFVNVTSSVLGSPTTVAFPSSTSSGPLVTIGTDLYSCFTIPTATPVFPESSSVILSSVVPSAVASSQPETVVVSSSAFGRRQVESSEVATATVISSSAFASSSATFTSDPFTSNPFTAPPVTVTSLAPAATPPVFICVPVPAASVFASGTIVEVDAVQPANVQPTTTESKKDKKKRKRAEKEAKGDDVDPTQEESQSPKRRKTEEEKGEGKKKKRKEKHSKDQPEAPTLPNDIDASNGMDVDVDSQLPSQRDEPQQEKKSKKSKKSKSKDAVVADAETPSERPEESAPGTDPQPVDKTKPKKNKKKKHADSPSSIPAPSTSSPSPSTSLSNAEAAEYLQTHHITIHSSSTAIKPIVKFDALPIPPELMAAFESFKEPTPIQACTWPAGLLKKDVVEQPLMLTRSGKTLAFGIPALSQLLSSPPSSPGVTVLVVAPTRELAVQTHDTLSALGEKFGIGSVAVFGGVSKEGQVKLLQAKQGKKSKVVTRIVVGTPGRIKDLVEEGSCDLSGVEYLVLDEADRMLDKGFENDIRQIIGYTKQGSDRQTMMFSATWPEAVRRLASTFQNDPVRVTVGSDDLTANTRVEQTLEVFDDARSKDSRLLNHIQGLSKKAQHKPRILVFALYKKEASRVEQMLRYKGFSVGALHGDMSQNLRLEALENFKTGSTQLLVATDVAARGLDIPNVEAVINYTFPLTIEDYIHRIGRTGRGGKSGKSITFFTGDAHEKALAGELARVLRDAGFEKECDVLREKFPMTIKKKTHSVLNVLKTYQALSTHFERCPADRERFPNFDAAFKPILALGADAPLNGEIHSAEYFHGRDGLGGITSRHPELNYAAPSSPNTTALPSHPQLRLTDQSAVDVALDLIRSKPARSLTYVALGPLTNLALLMRSDRQSVVSRLDRVVCMGGALDVPGNTSPVAEFNFFADPFAVHELLTPGSDIPEPHFPLDRFFLLPLDITTPHELPFPFYKDVVDTAFLNTTAPSSEVSGKSRLMHFTSSFLERSREVMLDFGKDAMELHDIVAVWFALSNPPVGDGPCRLAPGWRMTKRKFQIERTGELTRGMLVVDRREDETAYAPGANRAHVQAELERLTQHDHGEWESTALPARVEIEALPNKLTTRPDTLVQCVVATPGPDLLLKFLVQRVWGVQS
ncbi:hypothetical protein ONZ45_g4704 [Pleurotus djamor]|nr:hypothetical protein ONZ45_g4704 [Pleurotus djamor]